MVVVRVGREFWGRASVSEALIKVGWFAAIDALGPVDRVAVEQVANSMFPARICTSLVPRPPFCTSTNFLLFVLVFGCI